MHGPHDLNARLFALYYPHVCARAENAGQRETRRELLAEAYGRTLEFGAGTGINLPLYPESVSELIVTEPSPYMLARLRATLASDTIRVSHRRLEQCGIEELPCADASIDTVVGTFVLCSVPDPARALREIARVLKPGGRYLFLEHVRADDGTRLARVQDLLERPHVYVAAGCHPNRDTARTLIESPLTVVRLEHGSQPHAPPTVRPTVLGVAIRP